jgi:hypothetical protein
LSGVFNRESPYLTGYLRGFEDSADDGSRKGAIMRTTKIRHQFLLESVLSEKLEILCRRSKANKGAVVAKAVEAFLERRGVSELDERYAKRLDQHSRDLGKVRSNVEMTLESLALFIRYCISLTAHMPLPDKAMKALGYKRYSDFFEEVGRRIARGTKLFDEDDENKPSQLQGINKSDSVKDVANLPQCSSGRINREGA